MSKSPFLIIDQFISPLKCEEIINDLIFNEIAYDPIEKTSQPQYITDDMIEDVLFNVWSNVHNLPKLIADHYSTPTQPIQYKGMKSVSFELIPEGASIQPKCENSEYIDGRWVRVTNNDLCAVLFLSDYNDSPNFDDDYECCGGKLEMMNHQFSFNPTRGTLVIFPGDPQFINGTSKVTVGDCYQVRMHIATTTMFSYNPKHFPGNYKTWFR